MSDVKNVSLFTKMPPLIFNVGLFLGRRYWGDVKGLFCVSGSRPCPSFLIECLHAKLHDNIVLIDFRH